MELSNYNGSSMNPTFWPGDGLRIVPYEGKRIHCGDVVVFPQPNRDRNVVHRVVEVSLDGIRTRGDNNSNVDKWSLRPEDITGRVVTAYRKNRSFSVAGGRQGVVLAYIFGLKRKMDVIIRSVYIALHPLYRKLSETGIFQTWLSSLFKTKIVSFKRRWGTELHLVLGTMVIGWHKPGMEEWHIIRPFRLFVDVKKLEY